LSKLLLGESAEDQRVENDSVVIKHIRWLGEEMLDLDVDSFQMWRYSPKHQRQLAIHRYHERRDETAEN
jgi:hypothetical protein